MTWYSIQPKDQIFVKGYGFSSFAKNICKNISKNLSAKYSQKLFDHAKQNLDSNLFEKSNSRNSGSNWWLVKKLPIKLWGFQKTSKKKKI